ncbi:MAG: acetylglutamate kinase [Actinomycetota bacterium]|jgi:acetylglutamate kinase|nr:acetylglutamate kinase [Actinomycetota bacterium]|tara:strand:+ start:1672 stop:2577 length:906 start_codon:yes stop_codon:yes gene_type:complete
MQGIDHRSAMNEVEIKDYLPADRAQVLIEALPYIQRFSERVVLIKIGGSTLVDQTLFDRLAEDVVLLHSVGIKPIIVHGGGPQIGHELRLAGKETSFIDGLRVTDQETLKIVSKVLKGQVGRRIVDAIISLGGPAVSLSGETENLISVTPVSKELGFVGKITDIAPHLLNTLIEDGQIPVVSTLGIDDKGQSYNINADTAAGALAGALQVQKVIYLSDVPGLLSDKDDVSTLISSITTLEVEGMIVSKGVSDGMIPKVNSCIDALRQGVGSAHLLDGRIPHVVLLELFTDEGIGTMIVEED